jgi:ABC-2 type transport system ATP-binding protein
VPALAGVVAAINDSSVTLETQDLQGTLTAVLSWAAQHNLRLSDLAARPASLEEAFLTITGVDHEVPA